MLGNCRVIEANVDWRFTPTPYNCIFETTTSRGSRSQTLLGKFLFNQLMQMLGNSRVIETLDDFVQKAGD